MAEQEIPNYIIPQSYIDKKDLLWITFTAREWTEQKSYARSDNAIKVGAALGKWTLLVPNNYDENTVHQYAEYSSIPSRLAGKYGELTQSIEELKGAKNALNSAYEEARRTKNKQSSICKKSII